MSEVSDQRVTPELVTELTELEAQATPGPWRAAENRHPNTDGSPWGWLDARPNPTRVTWSGFHAQKDAALIAAARNTLPALLAAAAERDALESQLATVVEALEKAHDDVDDDGHGDICSCPKQPADCMCGHNQRMAAMEAALTDLASAVQAHDERMRAEERERIRDIFLHQGPDALGRALAEGGTPDAD